MGDLERNIFMGCAQPVRELSWALFCCVVLCSCEIGVKAIFVAFPSWCFCSGWRGVVFFIAVVVTIEAALDKLRSVVLI